MLRLLRNAVIGLIIATTALPTSYVFASTGVISENAYDKIILTSTLPDTFYKNEVFLIDGQITSGNYDEITAVLENSNGSKKEYFQASVKNNEFELPVFFTEPGNFSLGLIPGPSGTSKAKPIKVTSLLPVSNNPTKASIDELVLSVNFTNNQTNISLTNADNKIKKFTFTQNGKKVIYFSRQNKEFIPIRYNDFNKFTEAKVKLTAEVADITSQIPLTITTGFSSTISKSFTATIHQFSEIETSLVTTSVPEKLSSIKTISFTGTLKTDAKKTGYVIKPDGLVEEITLSTSGKTETYSGSTTIKSGSKFTYSYKPKKFGTYIVEVNDKEGIPIINQPVYIGSGIPLIPDFFDQNIRKLFSGMYNLNTFRQELLNQINVSRAKYGLSPVATIDELNILAQNHATDMVKNNYFSHTNTKGQSPEDRRIAQGVKTPVSENIAKDVSINFVHNGLMRSASHRSNILNADWSLVGIGIKEKNGYLIVSEEFSSKEPSQEDLSNYKEILLNEINKERAEKSTSLVQLAIKIDLESVSKYLNDTIIQNNQTLNELNQTSLDEAIKEYNIQGEVLSMGRTSNLQSKITASILEESEILKSIWEYIGIDVQLTKTGNIQAILTLLNSN